MEKKLQLIKPFVGQEEINAVAEVLRSGWLTEGNKTREFEKMVADYVGAKYAVATTNCTTALELSLRVLGIGKGDKVIVPDFTHPATADVVRLVGAEPVLADVDHLTCLIDWDSVSRYILKHSEVKCIIPVSWGGYPLEPYCVEMFKDDGIFILEDAACSLGAMYGKRKTGTMADMTCFSFHPRKAVTCGEGGMIVTDNQDLVEKMNSLKKFGVLNGKFTSIGTNMKMSDILAAVGVEQMKKIDVIIARRRELAKNYDELLDDTPNMDYPFVDEDVFHVYQTYACYVLRYRKRDKIISELASKDIEAQIGTYALHLEPAFSGCERVDPKLENSEDLYYQLLALPMSYDMTCEDQERVIKELKKVSEA